MVHQRARPVQQDAGIREVVGTGAGQGLGIVVVPVRALGDVGEVDDEDVLALADRERRLATDAPEPLSGCSEHREGQDGDAWVGHAVGVGEVAAHELRVAGAVRLSRGEPTVYGPVPPAELIEHLRTQATERLDAAEAALAAHTAGGSGEAVIWDIEGREAIVEQARRLIRSARSRILMEVWQADAEELRPDLADAADRGVRVIAVAYGQVDYPFAEVRLHPSTDEVTAGLGGRWLVVSADDEEIVAGNVSGTAPSRAAWTRHPGLAVPVTEQIIHDLYMIEMLDAHADVLEATFGPGLARLRQRYARIEQHLPA